MSKDSTESYGSGDSDSCRFVCDRRSAGGDTFDLVKTLGFVSDVFALFCSWRFGNVFQWCVSPGKELSSSIYQDLQKKRKKGSKASDVVLV